MRTNVFSGVIYSRYIKLSSSWLKWIYFVLLKPHFEKVGAVLDLPCPSVILWLSFRNLSNENFSSHFFQELRPRRLKLVTHMDSGQMYLVYRNQAAAAYSSLHVFIFLSLQFSNIKFFVTLFLGTVRPRRLKLSSHVDIGWMYCVYQNWAASAYSSLYYFIFLSLQFSNIKIFRNTFLRNCEA